MAGIAAGDELAPVTTLLRRLADVKPETLRALAKSHATLNGESFALCVAFSEIEGWVEVMFHDPGKPGGYGRVRRYGEVAIHGLTDAQREELVFAGVTSIRLRRKAEGEG